MTIFTPKLGQMDFTRARYCPVMNCVLINNGQVLIVKRGEGVGWYKGKWNGIGGFLDDNKSIREKVEEELSEELSIPRSAIREIYVGEIFLDDIKEQKKTWIIVPLRVEVNTRDITLDNEATEHRWVDPKDVKDFDIIPSFERVLDHALASDEPIENV